MAIGKHPVRAQPFDADLVAVRIFPNGTGTPTYTATGRVASSGAVTRTGAGVFRITLQDSPAKFLAITAMYNTDVSNEDLYAQGRSFSIANGTVDVALKTATSDTDVTADADKFIDVLILMEDSSLG